jgi:predicted GNAT family acetyltransferase
MTPTHPLVVTRAPGDVTRLLVAHLRDAELPPPAVTGPDETVAAFADAWCAATRATQRLGSMLGGFELTKVIPPPRRAAGHFREARDEDVERLVAWATNFFVETDHVGIDDPREVVTTRIREGRLFLWCDGSADDRPLCMGGWAGKTPNGVRVNFVYTPPEYRNRGYATACVAALSQALLDTGSKFCFLFTNLANATANRIYQRMGYRHIGNFRDVRFEPAAGPGDS